MPTANELAIWDRTGLVYMLRVESGPSAREALVVAVSPRLPEFDAGARGVAAELRVGVLRVYHDGGWHPVGLIFADGSWETWSVDASGARGAHALAMLVREMHEVVPIVRAVLGGSGEIGWRPRASDRVLRGQVLR